MTNWAQPGQRIIGIWFTICADFVEALTRQVKNMNRRKKIKQLLQAHAKKASAKLAPQKPKYISKADRAKLAVEADQNLLNDSSADTQ